MSLPINGNENENENGNELIFPFSFPFPFPFHGWHQKPALHEPHCQWYIVFQVDLLLQQPLTYLLKVFHHLYGHLPKTRCTLDLNPRPSASWHILLHWGMYYIHILSPQSVHTIIDDNAHEMSNCLHNSTTIPIYGKEFPLTRHPALI